jgi:hypothetical protein
MTRIQLIHGCVINWFNETHAKFGIKFATHDFQVRLADLVTVRLNLTNPYANPNVDFGIDLTNFPTENRPNARLGWTWIALDQLEASRGLFPVLIRALQAGNRLPLLYLAMGPYR